MTRLGAHLSISGGFIKSLERAKEAGANCLQIFSASPRDWNLPEVLESDLDKFRLKALELDIVPVYFHASYLINLANPDWIGESSKNTIASDLKIAAKAGITGEIVHLGSYLDRDKNKGFGILLENIAEILSETPKNTLFIIENAGNRKIGQNLEEIGAIVQTLSDKRVKVCLDTCHLYSGGYDLTSPVKFNKFLESFDNFVGLEKLELFHLNDSLDPLGSGRDRHANIGEGTIGLDEFKNLLNDPVTCTKPFIIETPGFKDRGPDRENLEILRKLVNQ